MRPASGSGSPIDSAIPVNVIGGYGNGGGRAQTTYLGQPAESKQTRPASTNSALLAHEVLGLDDVAGLLWYQE